MTMWLPKLDERLPTRYEQIAHAIERDIAAGRLKPGDKLPTQRALAKRLNVTVATCGRGYALAASRGLTSLEVGRGSFVAHPIGALEPVVDSASEVVADLRMNLPPQLGRQDIYAQTLQSLSASRQVAGLFGAFPAETYQRNRDAAAAWVGHRVESTPEEVLIVSGMQSALISGLSAVTEPGDSVLVEAHTFPGMLAAAKMLQLKLIPVAMDQRGIVVDDLKAKSKQARVVYLNPTNQNPTTSVLPVARRRAIGKWIRQQELWLFEDDSYGHFFGAQPPPVARFVPERCLYAASLSKTMSVGLRLAIMRVPTSLHGEVLERFRLTSFFPSPLAVEIATRWIEDGTASQLVDQFQEIATRRQQIARDILDPELIQGRPSLNHLWLSVPSHWTAESLMLAARENGVLFSAASDFSPTGQSTNRVRLALGGARNDEELKVGLAKIARLLEQPDSMARSRY